MTYLWNNFSFPLHNIDVGIGQGSALSPILLALYLFPIFYILEKQLKNLKIPVFILSFVDDGLFISQNKSIHVSNTNLFCSYNIVSNLLTKFGLIMEHGKTELFHFSRQWEEFNPPPVNLTLIGGTVLCPNESWRYLGFYFNCKLSFRHHINFYSNKAISTIKYMKMLGNSSRGLIPLQKWRLYRCCSLPIALYGSQVWYYNKVPLNYPFKILRKMQWRAALWINRAFWTLPSGGIEAISGFILIHLHVKKLYNCFLSRGYSLLHNYIIKSILSPDKSLDHTPYSLSLDTLTFKQRSRLNSSLIDMDNKKNEFIPPFDPFNQEFSPGNCLIDSFSDKISFHSWEKNVKNYIQNLDVLMLRVLSDSSISLVVSNASVKNNVTTSISHIHMHNKPVIKTLHHAMNVTFTEAELLAICCGINQSVGLHQINKIIAITDSLHAAKKIFESLIHPYQIHSAAISHELREFFIMSNDNHIKF